MARILIVDDEAPVRRVLRVGLTKAGHEVITAENGKEALAMLRTQCPDVVVTDIEMPIMDGRALCESIQQEIPERLFPLFVLTSLTESEHRSWSRNITDIVFLEKPVSIRILVGKIAAQLAQRAA